VSKYLALLTNVATLGENPDQVIAFALDSHKYDGKPASERCEAVTELERTVTTNLGAIDDARAAFTTSPTIGDLLTAYSKQLEDLRGIIGAQRQQFDTHMTACEEVLRRVLDSSEATEPAVVWGAYMQALDDAHKTDISGRRRIVGLQTIQDSRAQALLKAFKVS